MQYKIDPFFSMSLVQLAHWINSNFGDYEQEFDTHSASHFRTLLEVKQNSHSSTVDDEAIKVILDYVYSKNHAEHEPVIGRRAPGRPPKSDAKSGAQRQREYKARKLAKGFRSVDMSLDQIKYVLRALESHRAAGEWPNESIQLDQVREQLRRILSN